MSSEAEYLADRSALRALWRAQPDLTIGEYACSRVASTTCSTRASFAPVR
jgi:hypothetical protein